MQPCGALNPCSPHGDFTLVILTSGFNSFAGCSRNPHCCSTPGWELGAAELSLIFPCAAALPSIPSQPCLSQVPWPCRAALPWAELSCARGVWLKGLQGSQLLHVCSLEPELHINSTRWLPFQFNQYSVKKQIESFLDR